MTADTPRSRCEYYRNVCQLPAVIDPNTGRITLRIGTVSAVLMPSDLGQHVKINLDRRKLGGGPIISHPRSHTWIFLARPDIPTRPQPTNIRLWNSHATILETGAEIALPSPTDRGLTYRAWITPAHTLFRPSGRALLESIHPQLHPMTPPGQPPRACT